MNVFGRVCPSVHGSRWHHHSTPPATVLPGRPVQLSVWRWLQVWCTRYNGRSVLVLFLLFLLLLLLLFLRRLSFSSSDLLSFSFFVIRYFTLQQGTLQNTVLRAIMNRGALAYRQLCKLIGRHPEHKTVDEAMKLPAYKSTLKRVHWNMFYLQPNSFTQCLRTAAAKSGGVKRWGAVIIKGAMAVTVIYDNGLFAVFDSHGTFRRPCVFCMNMGLCFHGFTHFYIYVCHFLHRLC